MGSSFRKVCHVMERDPWFASDGLLHRFITGYQHMVRIKS
jgi:hypothetical protein